MFLAIIIGNEIKQENRLIDKNIRQLTKKVEIENPLNK